MSKDDSPAMAYIVDGIGRGPGAGAEGGARVIRRARLSAALLRGTLPLRPDSWLMQDRPVILRATATAALVTSLITASGLITARGAAAHGAAHGVAAGAAHGVAAGAAGGVAHGAAGEAARGVARGSSHRLAEARAGV